MKKRTEPAKKKDGLTRSLLTAMFIAIAIRSFAFQAFHIPSASMKNSLLVGDYLFVNELAYGFHTPKYLPFTNVPIPHFGFNYRDVNRGDVVVFEYPGDRDLVTPSNPNTNYIKRCVAAAGDIVEIRGKQLYVNGTRSDDPSEVRYDLATMSKDHPDTRTFPQGNPGWNLDWYGPLRIPKKGDVISIDSKNINSWNVFIEREGHRVTNDRAGNISIDGKPSTSYVVERDYLWMMGDNRDNSEDSRTWGFCPAENVVGNAMFVYWSWYNPPAPNERSLDNGYDPEETQDLHIRWNRIFNIIR